MRNETRLKYNAYVETVAGLLADQDMPDQVRARLHKALGLAQSESQPQEALAQFLRALQLDENVGVKKLIEQLERQIRNNPPDQSTE